ncbi:MAG TPA: ATPase, T2SS/T4P/T4SS family [Candidatus Acidoferrales bacterium]|nr:ATPase, T2SS/T4P/T4SS family [Candidatus Acidoferrales bacterium]
MKRKRLGEVLRERGHISQTDLSKAIQDQQGKLVHLGDMMLERGMVSKKDLASALTEVTHLPYVDCENVEIDPEILKLVPRSMAQRCCVLPIQAQGTKLVIAMAEPQNLRVVDELRFSTGMNIVPHLSFRSEIEAAIEKWYGRVEEAEATIAEAIAPVTEGPEMEFISSSSLQRNIEAMQEMQAELLHKSTPAVRLVASAIAAAAAKHASDIHVEPQSSDMVIRFRVDGMLRDYQHIPRSLQNSVVSRIKILSDMDIAERRAPQDGRFLVKIAGNKIDLRVSTLPTQNGEKVVMRLLESEAPAQGYAGLGMPQEIADSLTRLLRQPQGMILVTGPTGSGKSTTLYSSLNLVRRPTVNIITVEDPVEYVLQGLNQVQVNSKAGLTFATCLRSILRQDPNVIMVGEIRDKETAEIALKAAQTGHLLFSTLHTNDSISAITRLLDLGIPGFQIASSVTAILAQRLIRRLCSCHEQVPSTPEYAARLLEVGVRIPPAKQSLATGCENCDMTGYKGRIGVYEMLTFDEPIRAIVRTGARTDEIQKIAQHNGMRRMQEFALERVCQGETTLDEVLRVVPFDQVFSVRCHSCHRDLSPIFLFCPYCGKPQDDAASRKSDGRVLIGQGAQTE